MRGGPGVCGTAAAGEQNVDCVRIGLDFCTAILNCNSSTGAAGGGRGAPSGHWILCGNS